MINTSRYFNARTAAYAAIPMLAFFAAYSLSQTGAPNIAPVTLEAEPLYAQGAGQKPTLTLALSVEFPTVGAQYRSGYVITETYPGYFNPEKCYSYDATAAIKHFYIAGNASSHNCSGAGFSGNFLNWAASSAIDILRLGLTGGDRIEDTASSTILQRAVLPKNFYVKGNSNNFLQKVVANNVGRQSMPTSLFSDTTADVRISNCLDKIHIYTNGVTTQYDGSDACDNPNILIGPILQQVNNTNRPSGYTECASENGYCTFTGYREIIYGSTNKWVRRLASNGLRCDNGVLTDPAPGDTKKCYIKTTSLPPFPMETIAGNAENFLYARAKVCTSSDDRATLCQRYPNGNSKPVGNMQKYNDRVRLAAFGYLMENNLTRYGGVLRAPMTYVGPRSYDANGNLVAGTNPNAEWNSDTGVFIENPRNASEGISGVINYLNRFGRTGTPGTYKTYDTLSELYYESLRYLQGLQPTPQAVSGTLTNALKDGYPVYTSWDDPFAGGSNSKNYSCLRNSILTIADKNTHVDKSLPGNTRTNNDFDRTGDVNLSANVPNFVSWTRVLGGFESNNSVAYIDGDGVNRTTNNPTTAINAARWGMEAQSTGATDASYYMAGAAYWAHTHDIRGTQWSETAKQRPGMRVTTYVLDVNEGSASNDANTRRNTQLFLTAKYGGFNDADGDGNPFTPANDQGTYNSRHWEKETEPGEAKTYFLASNATAVLKALDDIFVAATKVSNTIASPATSSNQLSTADGYTYIASFDPEYWSGDLKRNTIRIGTSGAVEQGDTAAMLSAAAGLDARTTARNIVVGKSTGTAAGYGMNFTWTGIAGDTALVAHLNKANETAAVDSRGSDRLNFIRGDRSMEGTDFRTRKSRMGDIINSGVAFSGAPTQRYNTSSYLTFYNANKNRTKAVFVGANDGMLHAFNADTMAELFAYIPSWMGPKLSLLTDTNYNSSRHTSYVDATPVVGEAQLGNDWKTVLVSGTGGGGQGVFALDVTDPAAFSAANVLWEFTDSNDPDMGNVVGTPKIVKIRTNAKTEATATYKWFAVVASGVNNYVNDGTGRFSTTGKPALFLLDLAKAPADSWALGSNYFKITFPVSNDVTRGTQVLATDGTGTGQGKATGMINFDATGDANGAVQYFYVGDLHGQFWKLDMTAANLAETTPTGNWDLNKLSYFKNNTSSEPIPMFIAKDSSDKVQPISMNPSIAYGPENSYIVAFGTGKYLEASDNAISTSTQRQSFYVLYDPKDGNQSDSSGTAGINGRSRLQAAGVSGTTINTPAFLWTAATASTTGTTTPNKKAGWYIDYPNGGSAGGERQITGAALFGKKIIFTSLMPPTASTSACGGGSSYTYIANLASGDGTISAISAGAQGAPTIFNIGATLTVSDSTGLRTRTDKIVFGVPSSTGDNRLTISEQITSDTLVGRLSWRQINNYQDLKNKSTGWN